MAKTKTEVASKEEVSRIIIDSDHVEITYSDDSKEVRVI